MSNDIKAAQILGLGEEQLSTADSILQMKTALTELAVVIGDAISPAVVGVSKVIVAFANGLSDIIYAKYTLITISPNSLCYNFNKMKHSNNYLLDCLVNVYSCKWREIKDNKDTLIYGMVREEIFK